MNKDIAIKINKLTKNFYFFKKDIKVIAWLFNKNVYDKKYEVLKSLDLEVLKGESVGIIGVNGAGKSTLLKLISDIYQPTSGTIEVNGNISSLIELGAGFNGELTGRENVYYKSELMGLKKKYVDSILGEIEDFADIGEYFDMPLSSYSSGMAARLGFALAVNIDPEILIIDEVFAVGDSNFKEKSREKTMEFFNAGKTILFVSHSEGLIREFCNKVVYLKEGHIVYNGEVEGGLEMYNLDVVKSLEIPRFFVEKVEMINSKIEIIVNYGIGHGYTINEKLPIDEPMKIKASKFNGEVGYLFETYKEINFDVEYIEEGKMKIIYKPKSTDQKFNFRVHLPNYTKEKLECIFSNKEFIYDHHNFIAQHDTKDLFTLEMKGGVENERN